MLGPPVPKRKSPLPFENVEMEVVPGGMLVRYVVSPGAKDVAERINEARVGASVDSD